MNAFGGVTAYSGLIFLLSFSYFCGLAFRSLPSENMTQCNISVLVPSTLVPWALVLAVTASAREIASHLPYGSGHFHFSVDVCSLRAALSHMLC